MDTHDADLLKYAHKRRKIRRGNQARLLTDGAEVFGALRAAIIGATRSINLVFYIWRGGQTGWSFADLLMERARAGVEIRLMYDAWGCLDVDPLIFDTMAAEGIDVVQYKPVAFWRVGNLRRNHRKMVVVDDRLAFVGGINVADDYSAKEEGGAGWRDSAVELAGPVVRDINRLLLSTFYGQLKQPRPEVPRPPEPVGQADVMVSLCSNSERGQRRNILRSYLHAIKNASRSIIIANAYFLPSAPVRRALYAAAGRGVDVRVIVPSSSDVPVVQWATNHVLPRFVRRGVRIFLWGGVMMHAKIAMIDGLWSTVGSYNFDRRSLRANLEVNAVMYSRRFGTDMDAQLQRDLARCEELTRDRLARRSWLERARDWLAYQFRSLM